MERRFEEFPRYFRAFILFRRLCICATAGIFYASGLGIAGMYFLSLTEDQAFFFLCIPSALIITIGMFLKSPVFFAAWERKEYGLIDDRSSNSGKDR